MLCNVMLIITTYLIQDNSKSELYIILAQQMGQLLFETSFGINFILYCTSGQNFRREMVRICTKRSSTGRSGTLMHMANHGKQCGRHTLITQL